MHRALLLGLLFVAPPLLAQEEPALPEGLDDLEEPELSAGLDDFEVDAEAEPSATPTPVPEPGPELVLAGFLDLRAGGRLLDDPHQPTLSLGELRAQLRGELSAERYALRAVVDFLYDEVIVRDPEPDLETGEGFLDLRTLDLLLVPTDFMDLRIGRQVLTWGVGDLLFINDLFPKDWNAFFLGRDVEYLKAPSDALRLSLFWPQVLNAELVFTPRFDADRFPLRSRLSTYDPLLARRAGRDDPARIQRPERWFRDSEWAGRLYAQLGPVELAAYGYYGFFKTPVGFDPRRGAATFPRMAAPGMSARGPLLGGLLSAEWGLHLSLDDLDGDDPFVPNSRLLLLLGYERELLPKLVAGLQYQRTQLLEPGAHRRNRLPGIPAEETGDDLLTLRIRFSDSSERLTLSLFTFFGVTQRDAYLRPSLSYALADGWRAEIGGNILLGDAAHTRFGQLERNSNAWGALRYAW